MQRLRTLAARVAAAAAILIGSQSAVARAARLDDSVRVHRATAHLQHWRLRHWALTAGGYVPAYVDDAGELVAGRRWVAGPSGIPGASDQLPDPRDVELVWEGDSLNVKTTAGIDFTFSQSYNSTAAAQTNGLAWVGLSNDSLTETSASTTLSSEIASNGLTRAKGTYAHTNGQSTATNTITFTATGTQACQKMALFSASSSGTMHHALSFTQRTLQNGDSITITTTITIT